MFEDETNSFQITPIHRADRVADKLTRTLQLGGIHY